MRKIGAPKDWPKRFLASYCTNGNVTVAARAAGVTRHAVLAKQGRDAQFAAQMADAREEATDLLEEEARRRAHDGVEEPVFYKGDICGTVLKYSDTLLQALLKANRPDKYKDRSSQEITGKDGAAIEVTVQSVIDKVYGAAKPDTDEQS